MNPIVEFIMSAIVFFFEYFPIIGCILFDLLLGIALCSDLYREEHNKWTYQSEKKPNPQGQLLFFGYIVFHVVGVILYFNEKKAQRSRSFSYDYNTEPNRLPDWVPAVFSAFLIVAAVIAAIAVVVLCIAGLCKLWVALNDWLKSDDEFNPEDAIVLFFAYSLALIEANSLSPGNLLGQALIFAAALPIALVLRTAFSKLFEMGQEKIEYKTYPSYRYERRVIITTQCVSNGIPILGIVVGFIALSGAVAFNMSTWTFSFERPFNTQDFSLLCGLIAGGFGIVKPIIMALVPAVIKLIDWLDLVEKSFAVARWTWKAIRRVASAFRTSEFGEWLFAIPKRIK